MSDHLQFTVQGKTIPLFAQEPDSPRGERFPAIILLHGAGGSVDFWTSRFGPFLKSANMALYAPHYFARTETVRADLQTIGDGIHVPQWLATIDEALSFVASRPHVDPQRIVLAGISLGAFLALALAAQRSAEDSGTTAPGIRALISISGGLASPYDRSATSRFPPTLIIHGAEDNIVPLQFARDLEERLTSLDVAHRTEILERETHWFSGAALPRILLAISSFLQVHLQSASPRTIVL